MAERPDQPKTSVNSEGDPHWLDHRERRHYTHEYRGASRRERSREQVLRDWYGSEPAVFEALAHKRFAVHVGEALDDVLAASFGMADSVLLEAVQDAWPELVGEQIAAQSRPAALRKGRLDIEVHNASWLYVLKTTQAEAIAERVAEFSDGKVTDVRLVPGGRSRTDA